MLTSVGRHNLDFLTNPAKYAGLDYLYASLQGRATPEDIAASLLQTPPIVAGMSPEHAQLLQHIAYSRRPYSQPSAMADVFDRPASLAKQVATLRAILGENVVPKQIDGSNTYVLRQWIRRLRHMIGADRPDVPGPIDGQRLDRAGRRDRLMVTESLSHRRYNRLFRLIRRLEKETGDLERQQAVFTMLRMAKTNFAYAIEFGDFIADPAAAAFVAYLTATLARRSTFTVGSQTRSYDDFADMLYGRVMQSGNTSGYYAMAHVFPKPELLFLLDTTARFKLMEKVLEALRMSARLLRTAASAGNLRIDTMVVHRGDDSSTWNAAAGAWNKARDYWIALVEAGGMSELFDEFMPGKVLRLMAGDVTAWHFNSDGPKFHPDTYVWHKLPKPWEVVLGDAVCTKAMVLDACERSKVDPYKTGWARARARTEVADFEPTPELVHGIAVSSPALGQWLRKVGAWSGKGIRWDRVEEGAPQS